MTVVVVSPGIFSLLITIVSVACELALLSALLRINSVWQCRQLAVGSLLSLPRYRLRKIAITVLCMALFFSVEIFISANISTVFATLQVRQQCTVVSPLLAGSADVVGADVAVFSCLKVNDSEFQVFAGNYSEVSGRAQCSSNYSFRYTVQDFGKQALGNVSEDENSVLSCASSQFCTIARGNSSTLFISEPFPGLPPNADPSQLLYFFPTELAFDATPHLKFFASRAAAAFNSTIIDELDLRRRMIFGSEPSNCTFTSDGAEHTSIGSAVLGVSIATWAVCLLLYVMSIPMKRHVFFEVSDPLHWANRSRRVLDDEIHATHIRSEENRENKSHKILIVEREANARRRGGVREQQHQGV